jgi:hypothetical protein
MVYLGYDFDPGTLQDISNEAESVQASLSLDRLTKAKDFLQSVKNFIAIKLDLFRKKSELSTNTVGISIMDNYTGEQGFSTTEEKQAFHSDYPPSPSKN